MRKDPSPVQRLRPGVLSAVFLFCCVIISLHVLSAEGLTSEKTAGLFSPGVYYMPKPTIMAHQWEQLSSYNEYVGREHIKPAQGYYDANSVDVMKWEIDIAQRAGIEWFIFDVYLSPDTGDPWFTESLDAYLASPNRRQIKFATMYTNPKGLVPLNPVEQIRQFERYLSWNKKVVEDNPNYLRISGRPLCVLFRPSVLHEALLSMEAKKGAGGRAALSKGVRQRLDEMLATVFGKDRSRWPILATAKLPFHKGEANIYKSMGIDLIISYNNFIEITKRPGGVDALRIPYEYFAKVVLDNNELSYRLAKETGGMEVAPTITNAHSKVVLSAKGDEVAGASDEQYGALIADAVRMAAAEPSTAKVDGKKLICLGSWNEWSNGHAVAPGKMAGFTDEYGRLKTISRLLAGRDFQPPAKGTIPQKPVSPPVRIDTINLRTPGVPFFSWQQKASQTSEGIRVAFDDFAFIEFPGEFQVPKEGVEVVLRGRIIETGRAAEKLSATVRCRLHGRPVWDDLAGKTEIPAKPGEFSVKVNIGKGAGRSLSGIMRSLVVQIKTERGKIAPDQTDLASVVLSDISLRPRR